jgi:hypothetical protein
MSVCLWPILGVSPKHLPNNLPTKVSVQDPDWSEGDTFCLNSLLKILEIFFMQIFYHLTLVVALELCKESIPDCVEQFQCW